jgi:hypothetical protein
MIHRGGDDIRAHNHAGASARRSIVDLAVAARPEFAQGGAVKRPQAGFQGLARKRVAKRSWKHLREKRQN